MSKWHFCHLAYSSPFTPADESNTLAQQLAHVEPRIIRWRFGMVFRVFEHVL